MTRCVPVATPLPQATGEEYADPRTRRGSKIGFHERIQQRRRSRMARSVRNAPYPSSCGGRRGHTH